MHFSDNMGDLLKNSEKKEEMSLFIRTITKLAMEEGDFISQGTLSELLQYFRTETIIALHFQRNWKRC